MTETPLVRRDEAPDAAVRRLRRMLDVCVALNAVADLSHLLDTISRTVLSVLGCEAASILLHEPQEGALRFVSAVGGPGSGGLVGTLVPIEGSLAGTMYRENRPLLAADLAADERHFGEAAEPTGVTPQTLLGVPMRIDGEPVGVLEALNPRGDAFDASDAEMLLILAAQAAVAIRNARQAEALTDARDRLQELDRVKSRVMAVASHELRTPLTAIEGFGRVLAEEVGPELAGYAREVLDGAERMHEVVESLDEVSTLRQPVRLRSVETVDVAALARELAAAAGPRVRVEAAGPVAVHGELRRLRLALRHLVRNALAFSEAPVELRVRAEAREAAVDVRDRGIGLAAADLDRVFEPFVQVDDRLARAHEGIGMGLTVARAVVGRHGGRVWATSPGLGAGSAFHVRLPLAA